MMPVFRNPVVHLEQMHTQSSTCAVGFDTLTTASLQNLTLSRQSFNQASMAIPKAQRNCILDAVWFMSCSQFLPDHALAVLRLLRAISEELCPQRPMREAESQSASAGLFVGLADPRRSLVSWSITSWMPRPSSWSSTCLNLPRNPWMLIAAAVRAKVLSSPARAATPHCSVGTMS